MGGATKFLLLLTSPRPPLLRVRLPRLSPSSLATSFPASSSPLSRPQLFHLLKLSSSSSLLSSVDRQQLHTQATTYPFSSPSSSSSSSSWPEWSRLLERLSDAGYFNRPLHQDDEIVSTNNLSQDFLNSAAACLAFARDAPHLIRSLSTRDIEVLVQNVPPFLFLNGPHSAVKMTTFFEEDYFQPLESDQPSTVDLMRYLLCYASDFGASSHPKSLYDKELLALAVRNLFTQIANIIYNGMQPQPPASVTNQLSHHPAISSRQNVEMKRGDWICPGCSFLNFARNSKCLECERIRPKRQLTGGEWECPQCDFYNHNKNTSCLRCDCKRPEEASFNISNYQSGLKNGDCTNEVDIDSRLAANDEKAERWFNKVSQLDSSTGNSTIADDDFPEIMPLRKGVNRFVVSTRKTPLERMMSNTEGTFDNEDTSPGNTSQTGGTLSPSLDDILGHTSAADTEDKSFTIAQNAAKESSEHASLQPGYSRGSSSGYVPFVPLPADTFAKKPQNLKTEEENLLISNKESATSETSRPIAPSSWTNQSAVSEESLLLSQKPIQVDNKDKEKEQEQAEKSEKWFKRVAELHDVTDLTSEISDDDFPEIMPMRKGENRFVVSKKKDRSLTSPMYKRKMAMEQSSNTNFVPFVPFPPDYFTKKNNEQPDRVVQSKATDATPCQIVSDEVIEKKDYSATTEHQQFTKENWNSTSSAVKLSEINDTDTWGANDDYGTNNYAGPQTTGNKSDSQLNFRKDDRTNLPKQPENPNPRDSWTGKSLEGSAVKEIDPLDMSEEAKAERWFKRAAQIKDISELSQIPDEDFPSIMPMRKGVNRFVVSKRKTPLERRLTSPQYRRNLPVVSSEPYKKEDDNR